MIAIRLGIPTQGLIFCCAAIVVQAQPELPQWRVSPAPALTIGGDGAPSTEFSRIAAAVRLTKGEIVVADGATQQLRLFDGQGRFLRSFGRARATEELESLLLAVESSITAQSVFGGAAVRARGSAPLSPDSGDSRGVDKSGTGYGQTGDR